MPEDPSGTDELGTESSSRISSTKSRRPSKRLVAVLAAGALVLAGGITLTSVSVANATAEETARQCAVALASGAAATTIASISRESADAALEAVTSLALPGDPGWTSTPYASRVGNAAVAAVPAVDAAEGVEAVAAVDAVTERASGAELITRVSDDRAALVEVEIPADCTEREDAVKVASLAKSVNAVTMQLDAGVAMLLADFAAFQTDETARIAAEIEAARVAAEIEAARVAAAAEAARVAAAAEAARQAPARPAAPRGSGGGAATPPRTGGGGQVGPGNAPGVKLCDTGLGGVMAC